MSLDALPFVTRDIPERYYDEPRGKFQAHWRALAKPESEDELSALLAVARADNIPVTPYGGGTGTVGGQIYTKANGAICLSLEKMNHIEIQGNTALCGAGVILDQLHTALERSSYHFPMSLASSGSAQIGGLISTNAGGTGVIRYGSMGALTLGVRAHLMDGRIIDQTADLRKDNTGYKLDRLMIGAEGTLGVIALARLKLVPRDHVTTTILGAVRSPNEAQTILNALQKSETPINAFELISGTSWQFLEETQHCQSPIGQPDWSVLMEVADEAEAFSFVMDKLGETVLATNEAQAQALWKLREAIPLANRIIGAIASHDISLPLNRIAEFCEIMPQKLAQIDSIQINAFGHLGDGNLHYNLFPIPNREHTSYDAKALSLCVYKTVVEFGGSISAEHGIGRAKGEMMRALGQGDKLDLMKEIKSVFDPENLLNPGVFE